MASTSNNIITFRRHDLDNLKTFLSGLVVVHHTSISYGGVGGWGFRSLLVPKDYNSVPLLLFNAFNQSFFMGLFFWISGRMSAQALNKKNVSLAAFLRAKATRLLVPTIVNTLLGPPLAQCLAQGRVRGIFPAWWKQLRGARGVTWYTATLLVFDAAAALLYWCSPPASASGGVSHDEKNRGQEGKLRAAVYDALKKYGWALAAMACFFARVKYPVGALTAPLGVQPAYLPQYVLAYALGYLSLEYGDERMMGLSERAPSVRSDEPTALTPEEATTTTKSKATATTRPYPSLPLATTISAVTLAIYFLGLGGRGGWSGGWSFSAAAYACWNEFSFVIMGPALMDYFMRHHYRVATSPVWQARYSFAAFFLHVPLSIAVEVALDKGFAGVSSVVRAMESPVGRFLGPILLTGVVGYVNAAASFALSKWLLQVFPSLGRVL